MRKGRECHVLVLVHVVEMLCPNICSTIDFRERLEDWDWPLIRSEVCMNTLAAYWIPVFMMQLVSYSIVSCIRTEVCMPLSFVSPSLLAS